MKITVYSTTTCPYCKMLKGYLDEKGIAYTEKLVDMDEASRDEMMTKSGGFLGVPFTTITKESGEEVTVIGFDKGKIDSAVGL